jgi:hypothetical protein
MADWEERTRIRDRARSDFSPVYSLAMAGFNRHVWAFLDRGVPVFAGVSYLDAMRFRGKMVKARQLEYID